MDSRLHGNDGARREGRWDRRLACLLNDKQDDCYGDGVIARLIERSYIFPVFMTLSIANDHEVTRHGYVVAIFERG